MLTCALSDSLSDERALNRPRSGAFVMSGGDAVTTDTRTDPATIEARCRRLMAERAHLPDAYPHRDQRADLWALIHAELDAWLEAVS